MSTARSRRAGAVLLSAAAVLLAVTGCSSSKASSSGNKLSLVAYSVPKPAYEALQTAFAGTERARDRWASSYGASGTQSQAVSNGQAADYVAFFLEPDLTKLVPKFVDAGWNSGPTKGLVSKSVVVIATRKGNPLHIAGWPT